MSDERHFYPLSNADVSILNALQEDWSIARQDLADRVGMSLSTLRRRIRELEDAGLLGPPVALISAEKVGLSVCAFVFVDMTSHEPEVRDRFEGWVAREDMILECYSVTGQHDYTLIIRAPSVRDFERLLMDKILAHTSVRTATSQIALREHKYKTALPLQAQTCTE